VWFPAELGPTNPYRRRIQNIEQAQLSSQNLVVQLLCVKYFALELLGPGSESET
jgi:hypothetical protein